MLNRTMNYSTHPWRLRFRRLPFIEGVELLHAENVTHDYPRHMHEEYSIGVMLQGTEITHCRGASHIARPGSVILINAEEVHSNQSHGSSYRVIKMTPGLLNKIAIEFTGHRLNPLPFDQVLVKNPRLFKSLLNLHLKLEHSSSALEQESDLITAIGMLLNGSNETTRNKERIGREHLHVRRVREYLKSHYAENVTLSQLGSMTNLSPFYLLRVFHNQVGFPPHEYQTQLRIAHARKLIRKGHSLSQTALETGFFDQSHLTRNFKRIVGVSPRQYYSQRRGLDV